MTKSHYVVIIFLILSHFNENFISANALRNGVWESFN